MEARTQRPQAELFKSPQTYAHSDVGMVVWKPQL
jgi:hypothetical protein